MYEIKYIINVIIDINGIKTLKILNDLLFR
jgi:hypothetical protein